VQSSSSKIEAMQMRLVEQLFNEAHFCCKAVWWDGVVEVVLAGALVVD
jgi:hypothetical protein